MERRSIPGVTLRTPSTVAVGLTGLALAGWIVAVGRMRGMDGGPGTDLGSLVWFLGIWVTMTAAMMLPSAAPAVLTFARLRGDAHAWPFAAGYLLAWTGLGLCAYAVFRVVHLVAPSFLAWDERGPWVAGAALVGAGVYQLTPLKSRCLRQCRRPIHLLLHSRPGAPGALRTGTAYGAYCVGCCAGLMVALFALGVMSLFWMAVVAGAVFVEKVLPGGETFARALGVALVALGLWVAVASESVPGLTIPGGAGMTG